MTATELPARRIATAALIQKPHGMGLALKTTRAVPGPGEDYCARCSGYGYFDYLHINDGKCFRCRGTGLTTAKQPSAMDAFVAAAGVDLAKPLPPRQPLYQIPGTVTCEECDGLGHRRVGHGEFSRMGSCHSCVRGQKPTYKTVTKDEYDAHLKAKHHAMRAWLVGLEIDGVPFPEDRDEVTGLTMQQLHAQLGVQVTPAEALQALRVDLAASGSLREWVGLLNYALTHMLATQYVYQFVSSMTEWADLLDEAYAKVLDRAIAQAGFTELGLRTCYGTFDY